MNDKIKDLVDATKDEVIDTTLNSGVIESIKDEILQHILPAGAELFFCSILSALPPVNSIWNNYKFNRFKRNIEKSIQELKNKIDILNDKIESLNKDNQDKFTQKYLFWFLDSLENEKQEEKIPYLVNSYINLMNNEANDNLVFFFFETINSLSILDIETLKVYDTGSSEEISYILNKYGLNMYQLSAIKSKLERFGLLENRIDIQRDKNLNLVIDYLKNLKSEQRKRNPKEIRIPTIKQLSKTSSYRITNLGRDFLKSIASIENDN